MPLEHKRTAVLGIGNPLLCDDRVGLAVASAVERLLEESPIEGVEVLTTARGGLELIDLLSPFSRAILVDCLIVPDVRPGRIRRLELDDVAVSSMRCSAHEIGVAEALEVAARLKIPMPRIIDLFAVEGEDTTTITEQMTREVTAAVEPLARRIYGLLAQPDIASRQE